MCIDNYFLNFKRQNEINPKDRVGKQYSCNSGWNGGANQLFLGGGQQQFGGYPEAGASPQYGGGGYPGGNPQYGYPSGGGYGWQQPSNVGVRYYGSPNNAWNSNPFFNFGNGKYGGSSGGGGGPVISGSPYPQIQIQNSYPGPLVAYGR
jgi:hypothetical protein